MGCRPGRQAQRFSLLRERQPAACTPRRATGCDMDTVLRGAPALLLPCCCCSGQIGFMICTKAAGGSGGEGALDPREPRLAVPPHVEGKGYPPLR